MGLFTVRTIVPVAVTAAILATAPAGAATAGRPGLPKPPDGAVQLTHHSRSGVVSASYRIKGTTPRAVARHYRKAFKAHGFSIRYTQNGRGYSNLYMKRPGTGVTSFVGAGSGRDGKVFFEVCKGTNHLQVDICG